MSGQPEASQAHDSRNSNASVWAIVVAAGSGSRFRSDQPKQYEMLGNLRCLDHALAAAQRVCPGHVVLVVAPDRLDDPEPGADYVRAGGATRSASVRAGLTAVSADATIVVVHDAARPLAGDALWARVIAAVRGDDGVVGTDADVADPAGTVATVATVATVDAAVPGLAVTDTIKQIDEAGVVTSTPPRASLVAVQTPQAFRAEVLRRAHEGDPDGTDDAALVETIGGRVVVVAGDVAARKVTTREDLALLSALLDQSGNG